MKNKVENISKRNKKYYSKLRKSYVNDNKNKKYSQIYFKLIGCNLFKIYVDESYKDNKCHLIVVMKQHKNEIDFIVNFTISRELELKLINNEKIIFDYTKGLNDCYLQQLNLLPKISTFAKLYSDKELLIKETIK